ncbi:hypothetical protein PAXRUDRAFT_833317, partial [Paxillus rubicundulus Ve08.2h10]
QELSMMDCLDSFKDTSKKVHDYNRMQSKEHMKRLGGVIRSMKSGTDGYIISGK